MRILVIGAGAIGGYFGGRLLKAGRDVTFLVRPGRAAQLAESGLVIKSPQGNLTLPRPATLLAAEIRHPYDLVLLSCKAYDLTDAMESFAPAIGPKTRILPLLNGLKHLEMLDARFSGPQVLGGRCVVSVTLDEAGTIVHLSPMHSVSFGERDGALSPQVQAICSQLADAGFDVVASEQILQEMWEKWVFIATLAGATCLMRGSIGSIVSAPGGEAMILQLLAECCAIAQSHGHAPRAPFLAQSRAMLTAPDSPTTASMLRDIEHHARIEADHILGDLLRRRHSDASIAPEHSLLQIAYCNLKVYEAKLG
jgi:2-dehydropantoate 2-reductase